MIELVIVSHKWCLDVADHIYYTRGDQEQNADLMKDVKFVVCPLRQVKSLVCSGWVNRI